MAELGALRRGRNSHDARRDLRSLEENQLLIELTIVRINEIIVIVYMRVVVWVA